MIPNGVWPVMLTPFRADLTIDWDGLDRLIEWYVEAGVAGLFSVCLSSEMFELEAEERIALARHVVRRAPENVPVVASGTFGDSLHALADGTRRMSETGVASVVCLTAALATKDEDELSWRRHAEQLLERTDDIPLGLGVAERCFDPPYAEKNPARDAEFLFSAVESRGQLRCLLLSGLDPR